MANADSGVYAIRNRHTLQTYVGKAEYVGRRWADHRRLLEGGSHHCVALQESWNLWGADSFEWILIHSCAHRCTVAFEWWALQLVPPALRLNTRAVVKHSLPGWKSDHALAAEVRRREQEALEEKRRLRAEAAERKKRRPLEPEELVAFIEKTDIKAMAKETGLAVATIYRAKKNNFKKINYSTFEAINKYAKAKAVTGG